MSYDLVDERDGYLDESGGVPLADVFPDVRGLVMTNGRPYILLTIVDDEGGVDVSSVGVPEDRWSVALREVADLLEAQA